MNAPDDTWTLKTLAESAATLSISKSSLRRLIRAGAISTVRVGGRRLLDSRDLERFVESAKETAPATHDQNLPFK